MLWIVIGVMVIIAAFIKFTQNKTFCKVFIFEEDGNKIIQHGQVYNGVIREAANRSKTQRLRWLYINHLKKNFIIPQSKYFTHTSGKTPKSLYLLWDGKETFKVVKPTLNKFLYQAELLNGKKHFKQIPMNNVEFSMNDNDWEYMQSELKDTLENIYKEKESFLERLKPYYAIAVICLIAIVAIYMVQKTAVQTSNDIKENKNWLMNSIEGLTTRQPDPNTRVVNIPQSTNNIIDDTND